MGDDEAGLEVAYKRFSINSHALGHGDPIRVRQNQRVTVFHCHQQMHMDYGFMAMVEYV